MRVFSRPLAKHPGQFTLWLLVVLGVLLIARNTVAPTAVKAGIIINNDYGVASVSAASFVGSPWPIAPDTIVAAYGTRLCTATAAAAKQPLPTTLAGTSVKVNNIAAPLFFVSPGQVNYLAPPTLTAGDHEVVISATQENGDVVVSKGLIKIGPVSPAIFTANSSGNGAPAAVIGRVDEKGNFGYDPRPPFEWSPGDPGRWIPSPIEVVSDAQPTFLILFGSGMKNAAPGTIKAIMGGIEIAVTPNVVGGFVGLEQVNVPIPVALKGRGPVDLRLVADGVPSNQVTVNVAGVPDPTIVISDISTTEPVVAGQMLTIKGKGFSRSPEMNIVRFGEAQTYGVDSTENEVSVIVPFGAESSRLLLQTPQGETWSEKPIKVVTSISGYVQTRRLDGSGPTAQPGVTVRNLSTNATFQTNSQGVFVMPHISSGNQIFIVDPDSVYSNPTDPKKTYKVYATGDRDNPMTQTISLTPPSGGVAVLGSTAGGGNLTNGSEAALDLFSLRSQLTAAIIRQQAPSLPQADAGKSIVISDKGVSLEVPVGTGVRFSDGKTSGAVQVTRIEPDFLPGVSLPLGVYSNAIVQITPFGASFTPGASISFPNPDPKTFGPGEKIDLYRFDFEAGAFIKRGVGKVSQDRSQVVSDGRIVDLTSLWLCAPPSPTTVARGKVIDQHKRPVAGAKVSFNGRSNRTDSNGGFNIPDIATLGIENIQAEATFLQPYGSIMRGVSSSVPAKPGGVTDLKEIQISVAEQPSLSISPISVNLDSNAPPVKMKVTLTTAAPAGGAIVSLTSTDTNVATVPSEVRIPAGKTTTEFELTRRGPGAASIEASATIRDASPTASASVTVAQSAPQLTGVSPRSAPPGARVVITGVGLKGASDGNTIGFVRNNKLIAVLDPDKNESILDESGQPAVRIIVPRIAQGPVSIVAAVVEGRAGVISDVSNPLDFTVDNPNAPTPVLASVTPDEGRPRGQATITGTGFSNTPAENLVYFRQGSNASQARVIRANATQLVVEVPSKSIAVGKSTIVARRRNANGAQGNLSNALDFRITALAGAPVAPTIASALNAATGQASGRDGQLIRVRGTGLGENFYIPETDKAGNDEPVMSILFFAQNNQIVGFSLPIAAQGGTQINVPIPSGLRQGLTTLIAVAFDVETGMQSEESNAVSFTLTAASLRRLAEDEPNNTPRTATNAYLQTIVDGKAAKTDAAEYIDSKTSVRLPDLFLLSIKNPTTLQMVLEFAQGADLDLFVYTINNKGEASLVGSSTNRQGVTEGLRGTLRPGDYYIAVGAAAGSSRYTLTILDGAGAAANLTLEPLDSMEPDALKRVDEP
jgi:uncharacterized protein (TIGR03437 family)